eukprot:XP_014011643.1 PREDICTED: dynein heavy chain 2, axonemal-like [Salmo salar]
MNNATVSSVDLSLFNSIIQDLFPAVETPTIDYRKLREPIEAELRRHVTLIKAIQLYETKNSRHATVIVGQAAARRAAARRAAARRSPRGACRAP